MPLYIGESAGARVIEMGTGRTDATSASTTGVLLDLETHEMFPAGASGDVVFRGVAVTVRHDSGFQIGVTPYVDGSALAEQTFSYPAPSSGEMTETVQAFIAARGAGVRVRVRQTAATGMVEIKDVASEHAVLRAAP